MAIAIDVVIGLLFFYLLMSIICTTVNELIAGATRLRARTLYKEIARIIDNPEALRRFWNNGLIRALCRDCHEVTADKAPSYIKSAVFAKALLAALNPPPEVKGKTALVSEVIPDGSILKNAIMNLEGAVTTQAAPIEKDVSEWFDTIMERTSGVYKRRMQLITFGVAFVIATALNANSFTLAEALWHDEAFRAQTVAAAQAYIADDEIPEPKNAEELLAQVEQVRAFPLGWDFSADTSEDGQDPAPEKRLDAFLAFLTGLGGILATTLAMSLGAPFWFDLLQKVINLRSSGARQEPQPKKEAAAEV